MNIIKILFNFLKKLLSKDSQEPVTEDPFKIVNAISSLPWHKNRKWSKRGLKKIKKIIVHQELGMGSVEQVNNYHITPGEQNHLTKRGAPHFSYHYGIDLDGTVYKANSHSSTTWHTRGQNSCSISIMVAGDFSGDTHKGKLEPTDIQKKNLQKLLDHLILELSLTDDDIYGHCDFGKPACPGTELYQLILNRRVN